MSRKAHLSIYAGAAFLLGATAAQAGGPPLSSAVTVPPGGNYGSTSYFDGFGRQTEGFSLLEYGRYEDLDVIRTDTGAKNPLFSGEDLNIYVLLTQISWTSGWHPNGDNVGFSFALPIADLNASFGAGSIVKLQNNHFNIGDAVFGPIYQSKIYKQGHRPLFAWRFQFIVLAPTGGLNRNDAINQGSGQWAVNPYISMTYLPLPDIELSTRFNYQYNFKTSELQAPISPLYKNGQAGQMIYDNFDASYKITKQAYLGMNGYFIDQLTSNRTNGIIVPHSRESEVYFGPGGRYVFDPANALNVNLYFNVEGKNATTGTVLNFQYVHRF